MTHINETKQPSSFTFNLLPFSKMLYVFVAIVSPILIGETIAFVLCSFVSICLLFSGRNFKKALPMVGLSLFLIISIAIIQGMFNKNNITVLVSLGAISLYKEGLIYAGRLALNVINIIFAFSILTLTTKPTDIANSFVRVGLSPRFGYVISSVFQIVPQMSTSVHVITDAQRSRGMKTTGNLWIRMKAFFPLILPVVMSSLVSVRERSIALESRGFGMYSTQTFLKEQVYQKADKIFSIILLSVFAFSIFWRVLIWLSFV